MYCQTKAKKDFSENLFDTNHNSSYVFILFRGRTTNGANAQAGLHIVVRMQQKFKFSHIEAQKGLHYRYNVQCLFLIKHL